MNQSSCVSCEASSVGPNRPTILIVTILRLVDQIVPPGKETLKIRWVSDSLIVSGPPCLQRTAQQPVCISPLAPVRGPSFFPENLVIRPMIPHVFTFPPVDVELAQANSPLRHGHVKGSVQGSADRLLDSQAAHAKAHYGSL